MDELAQRFAALTDKYGPHVVESGLTAARISGLTNVAIGIMWLLLCAAACGCGWYVLKNHQRLMDDHDWERGECIVAVAVIGVIALGTGIGALVQLCDPWVWVAIFNPEVAIAGKVLGL